MTQRASAARGHPDLVEGRARPDKKKSAALVGVFTNKHGLKKIFLSNVQNINCL
jgi:hypothetical protein